MKQSGYEIGPNGKPVTPGVICRCGDGFCPMHGTNYVQIGNTRIEGDTQEELDAVDSDVPIKCDKE